MIHNVIEVDGLEYKAVAGKDSRDGSCDGCAFLGKVECGEVHSASPCVKMWREGGQNVIFKRHYKLKDCK